MITYYYIVTTTDNATMNGFVKARTRAHAVSQIREKHGPWLVLELKMVESS